jgi:hypothetical protein
MARAVLMALAILGAWPIPAAGQGQERHGENSVFASPGVTIAWGVRRGATEEATEVVVRIVVSGGAYTQLDVEMVDPFTRERRAVLRDRPLAGALDVRSPRASFADFPRREFRFRSVPEGPVLTVYYLGVPDTTPEFTSEAALAAYLDDAVTRTGPARAR